MNAVSLVSLLRNRKNFPCFYRVIETRVEVWEKREIPWEHEHEVRVFPHNFENFDCLMEPFKVLMSQFFLIFE
jgi:hypothetical protein